jgi:hypothetical protein
VEKSGCPSRRTKKKAKLEKDMAKLQTKQRELALRLDAVHGQIREGSSNQVVHEENKDRVSALHSTSK